MSFQYFHDRDLYVETEYTRRPKSKPVPPDGLGWILWDTTSDHEIGWIRIWFRPERELNIHRSGGAA